MCNCQTFNNAVRVFTFPLSVFNALYLHTVFKYIIIKVLKIKLINTEMYLISYFNTIVFKYSPTLLVYILLTVVTCKL